MSVAKGMPGTNAAAREAVIAEYLKALKLRPSPSITQLLCARQETVAGMRRTSSGELLEVEVRLFGRSAPPRGA